MLTKSDSIHSLAAYLL